MGEPQPVEVVWERQCTFKAKPCSLCGKPKSSKVHTPKRTAVCPFKRQNGCANCGLPKGHADHFGAPPSLNVYGRDEYPTRMNKKRALELLITQALEDTDLPRPCESITVECEITFPDLLERDEGNIRAPFEKALGDALKDGGWLRSDAFYPRRRFTFGGITPRHEPGVLRTRLLFFPSLVPPESVEAKDKPQPSLWS